jgi:hypothetical protein
MVKTPLHTTSEKPEKKYQKKIKNYIYVCVCVAIAATEEFLIVSRVGFVLSIQILLGFLLFYVLINRRCLGSLSLGADE